jgi:hypothetical protein
MLLNWVRLSMTHRLPLRLALALLMPVWLAFCLAVNMCGSLLDAIDGTGVFYHNVLVTVRKPAQPQQSVDLLLRSQHEHQHSGAH